MVIGLNVYGQEQSVDSTVVIVEKVVVKFDFSRSTSRRMVYKDSTNLAKMDYLYDRLHSDLDLRLRINVHSNIMHETNGFDISYAGAKDLASYLVRKDLSSLKSDFFYSIEMIELTSDELANGGSKEHNRVEFILFK